MWARVEGNGWSGWITGKIWWNLQEISRLKVENIQNLYQNSIKTFDQPFDAKIIHPIAENKITTRINQCNFFWLLHFSFSIFFWQKSQTDKWMWEREGGREGENKYLMTHSTCWILSTSEVLLMVMGFSSRTPQRQKNLLTIQNQLAMMSMTCHLILILSSFSAVWNRPEASGLDWNWSRRFVGVAGDECRQECRGCLKIKQIVSVIVCNSSRLRGAGS